MEINIGDKVKIATCKNRKSDVRNFKKDSGTVIYACEDYITVDLGRYKDTVHRSEIETGEVEIKVL